MSHLVPLLEFNQGRKARVPLEKGTKIRRLYIPQSGTHASPGWHWVRGAFKMVPYGKERKLRREKWIAPYSRGIKEEEDVSR
jgi:hypothetical protein